MLERFLVPEKDRVYIKFENIFLTEKMNGFQLSIVDCEFKIIDFVIQKMFLILIYFSHSKKMFSILIINRDADK